LKSSSEEEGKKEKKKDRWVIREDEKIISPLKAMDTCRFVAGVESKSL
jgi:hypothetical protein